jgi:serine/threonine protein kinase
LYDLLKQNPKKKSFSLSSVLKIGIQMVSRLEKLHQTGWIHCDIKPQNIVIGSDSSTSGIIHLIDFGCAHRFLD